MKSPLSLTDAIHLGSKPDQQLHLLKMTQLEDGILKNYWTIWPSSRLKPVSTVMSSNGVTLEKCLTLLVQGTLISAESNTLEWSRCTNQICPFWKHIKIWSFLLSRSTTNARNSSVPEKKTTSNLATMGPEIVNKYLSIKKPIRIRLTNSIKFTTPS